MLYLTDRSQDGIPLLLEMTVRPVQRLLLLSISGSFFLLVGCAEGPLWKAGQYLPWVQSKWEAEEQIAETVHAKKARIRNLAKSASQLSEAEKENAVNNLSQMIQTERIDQIRVDAAYALGELKTESAEKLLLSLLEDSETEVRIAAVNALAMQGNAVAGQQLVRIIRSDSDKDVRSAAIRNLAKYPGDATVAVLGEVLSEPEPALQIAATESLDKVTGEKIGMSVPKWKEYLSSRQSTSISTQRFQSKDDTDDLGSGFEMPGQQ